MNVREASDGARALELATADPPDAILLDVMMPGLDGWAVAAELRERAETCKVPIVFVTARVSDADRALREARAARLCGFRLGGGLNPAVVEPQNRGFTPTALAFCHVEPLSEP